MELRTFLVKAKTSTYASQAAERVLDDESKELSYKEGDFLYRDRYYGSNPFFGQEIVRQQNNVVWFMNYYGKIISDTAPIEETYAFLRKAMMQVTEERPFRGPERFTSGEFTYIDTTTGSISDFKGEEKILFQGREIYRLLYHGGTLAKNIS